MYTCLSYTRIVTTYMNSSYTRRIVIHELGARARAKPHLTHHLVVEAYHDIYKYSHEKLYNERRLNTSSMYAGINKHTYLSSPE